jgi:hypothetical protein
MAARGVNGGADHQALKGFSANTSGGFRRLNLRVPDPQPGYKVPQQHPAGRPGAAACGVQDGQPVLNQVAAVVVYACHQTR